MNTPLKLKVILGSTRQGRFGDKAAKWVVEKLNDRTDVAVEFLDLRDYPMPFFNEVLTPSSIKEPYADPGVQKWTQKIADGDAFLVLTPEYNHGPSAILKNAFDYVGREWQKKPIGFVGWGTAGGARAIEQLRDAAIELQMAPIRAAVYIVTPWTLPKEEDGTLKPGVLDAHSASLNATIDQLVWWGTTLKPARESEK